MPPNHSRRVVDMRSGLESQLYACSGCAAEFTDAELTIRGGVDIVPRHLAIGLGDRGRVLL